VNLNAWVFSPNALVNKVMLQYKDVFRFDEHGNWLMMTRETFIAILDHLSLEEIENIAYEYARLKLYEKLMRRGLEVNPENIRWFIVYILGKYGGWFRCEIYESKERDIMHLQHVFGKKWSQFISSYISSILHGELGLKVQSVIMENDVHITITK
jgi:hypothetical protein